MDTSLLDFFDANATFGDVDSNMKDLGNDFSCFGRRGLVIARSRLDVTGMLYDDISFMIVFPMIILMTCWRERVLPDFSFSYSVTVVLPLATCGVFIPLVSLLHSPVGSLNAEADRSPSIRENL